MLNMQLPQRRKKGSPQRRFMDVVKKDTVGATEDEAEADDPQWRPLKEAAERRTRL